ncbi:MAG: DUF5719 family protein [Acidimicrobiales bacterium]
MSERRHTGVGGVARAPIVVVLAAALIGGGLLDRLPGQSPSRSAAAKRPVPVAAPPLALTSSWFCAGATGTSGGAASGTVVIANSGIKRATGVVTLVPSRGSKVKVPVSVPRDARVAVPETVSGGAPWIGAIVDVDAGAVAVVQQVDGPDGTSATPCATAGSSHWYFSTGATLVNASEEISLLNPYPSDAIVDLSFTTNQGLESPNDYRALAVPAGGMLNVNLGDHLRRRQSIATTVTVSSGRVVAWKTDVVTPPAPNAVLLGTPAAASPLADPAAPVPGVTVTLGSPGVASKWVWPSGTAGNGVDERYVIYNPGPGTADLKLALLLDQGVAEPFELSVGPEQVATVVSAQEARVPAGVAHAAVLESTNGVGVVAERTVAAAQPSPWSGLGELPGGTFAAPRWLLAGGKADRSHDGWVMLYNPGPAPATASVAALTGGTQVPLRGMGSIAVPPARRVAVHLNDAGPSLDEPLVVSASQPVYVEANFYGRSGSPGVSLSFGVPLTP